MKSVQIVLNTFVLCFFSDTLGDTITSREISLVCRSRNVFYLLVATLREKSIFRIVLWKIGEYFKCSENSIFLCKNYTFGKQNKQKNNLVLKITRQIFEATFKTALEHCPSSLSFLGKFQHQLKALAVQLDTFP